MPPARRLVLNETENSNVALSLIAKPLTVFSSLAGVGNVSTELRKLPNLNNKSIS